MKTTLFMSVVLSLPFLFACSEQITGGIASTPSKIMLTEGGEDDASLNQLGAPTSPTLASTGPTPESKTDVSPPTDSDTPSSANPAPTNSPPPTGSSSGTDPVASNPTPSAPENSPPPSTPPTTNNPPVVNNPPPANDNPPVAINNPPTNSNPPSTPPTDDDDQPVAQTPPPVDSASLNECARAFQVPSSRVKIHKEKGSLSLKATDVVMIFVQGNASGVSMNLSTDGADGKMRGLCIKMVGNSDAGFNIDGVNVGKLFYRGVGSSTGHIKLSNGGNIAQRDISLSGKACLEIP